MRSARLPHIDEHPTLIAAEPAEVWRSLLDTLERSFTRPGAAGYARLVRARDTSAGGPRPITTGSSLPGFHVAAATVESELVLEGRHRFSSYALVFRIERADPKHTRLCGETRATFPGPVGAVYRGLVIATGGHGVAVRRMLAAVRRGAEAPASTVCTH